MLLGLMTTNPHALDDATGAPASLGLSFFNGELAAAGVILDRGGGLLRRFSATMRGRLDAHGQGTLDEDFRFDDGERLQRQWRFTREDGRLTGRAEDIAGAAALTFEGPAIHMAYTLILPYKTPFGATLHVRADDRLWLTCDPKVVVNKSVLRKWGLRVGEILTVIEKP